MSTRKPPPARVWVSFCETCGVPITADPCPGEPVPTVCPTCPSGRRRNVSYAQYTYDASKAVRRGD